MEILQSQLQDVFTKNRTEEIGYDVWDRFVIPHFFNRLDLRTARKPRIIMGGRGCGKTMLLRYFSHQTTFSKQRQNIPDDATDNIGLYWRADTQFCGAMSGRGVPSDIWAAAFNHYVALTLSREVVNSLYSIGKSSCPALSIGQLESLDLSRLRSFDESLPARAPALLLGFQERVWSFEAWVNDVRKKKEPYFLPGQQFVLAIVQEVRRQLPGLGSAGYSAYLDEYENLTEYQQRIINTWLKHSEYPLIFNLAMKRNAFETRETVGPESISAIHDFRIHDLESYLLDENYLLFAAEILFMQLSFAGVLPNPVSPSELRDPAFLKKRQSKDHGTKVLAAVQKIFPDESREALAKYVFADGALAGKLLERIRKALSTRRSGATPERFFRPELPEASIVVPALLHRRRLMPEKVLEELDKLERGEKNNFTGETDWIHNNFAGSLLQLYVPFSRPCPFYSGFRSFCQLSRGNIRHLLELFHKSLFRAVTEENQLVLPVSAEIQATASRQASTAFLSEIKSFGRRGIQLYAFVLRLGSLFALAHRRPTQSESEQSHFTITKGNLSLEESDQVLLHEATKWSVLFEESATKQKSEYEPRTTEYILNPIYAPYFHISFLKKRNLEISSDDLACLIHGSLDEFESLMRRFSKRWEVESSDLSPTLFSLFESKD